MHVNHYLQRIAYQGEKTPNFSTLCYLQRQHLLHVPFENLAIHDGREINLSQVAFYEKIVTQRQGGFCYELNGLFYWLLSQLGFNVRYISARVATANGNFGADFDHMALLVDLIDGFDDGQYLVDVGFGEFAFAPLLLQSGLSQHDLRGEFMLTSADDGWQVDKSVNHQWRAEYRFSESPQALNDFSLMCDYHQNSPESYFTQKRLISRPTSDGRITLSGDKLIIRDANTTTTTRFSSGDSFASALATYFPDFGICSSGF